jgi:hypothetical protein
MYEFRPVLKVCMELQFSNPFQGEGLDRLLEDVRREIEDQQTDLQVVFERQLEMERGKVHMG